MYLSTRFLSSLAKSVHKYHGLFQDLKFIKRINQSQFEMIDKSLYLKDDILINNMKEITESDSYGLYKSYILESDTPIIDVIKKISDNKPITMHSSMFVQLYYVLEKNPDTNKFIFRLNNMNPQLNSIINHQIDKNTNRIWTIYPSTFQINSEMYNIYCPDYYVDIIQINNDKFIGLTIDGYKIYSFTEWIEYIYNNSKIGRAHV